LQTARRKAAVTLGLVILVGGFVVLSLKLGSPSRQTAVDLFWQSVRTSSAPAIICPAAMVRDPANPYGLSMAHKPDEYTFTSARDTLLWPISYAYFRKTRLTTSLSPPPQLL
jgi:hypothetical protein